MPTLPESLAVLRLREFRLVFGAQAVSVIGDRMVGIALAFAVLELNGSPTDVGLVLGARLLPLVGFLLVGGVVADRVSRQTVMVVADCVRVVTQGVMAGLLIAGVAQVWTLALLAGLTGAATGFFNPASTGLLPTLVPRDRLQQANGLRATAMSGGEILGPVLAGGLVAAAGPGWALGIDSATFAGSALFLVRLRLPASAPRAATTFLADLAHGWSEFSARTWVWTFVLAAAFGNLVWGAWSTLGPVVAERSLGGAAAWGTILGAMGVGALAGSIVAVRTHFRRPMVVATVTFAFFGTPLALLAVSAPVPLVAAGALLTGGALMLGNTIWESTLQRHIPAASLSRVSAYDWFGSLAFQPLGLAIWGPIASVIGISAALWVAFAGVLVNSVALLLVKDIRRLE